MRFILCLTAFLIAPIASASSNLQFIKSPYFSKIDSLGRITYAWIISSDEGSINLQNSNEYTIELITTVNFEFIKNEQVYKSDIVTFDCNGVIYDVSPGMSGLCTLPPYKIIKTYINSDNFHSGASIELSIGTDLR